MRSSWSISRRTCLKGLGVTLGLPLLEVMGWADPPKGAAYKPPVRIGFMYLPNGVWRPDFWPTDAASYPTVLPKTLEVLRPIIADCLLLDQLAGAEVAESRGPQGRAPHMNELSSWLTATQFNVENKTNIDIAVSADQIAAQQIGAYTVIPSLELGYFENSATGLGENGANNRYYRVHSFRTPTEALPLEISPANVLKRMFSSRQSKPRKRGGPAVDPAAFSSGSTSGSEDSLDRSMLDLVRASANDLRSKVSIADQRSLDQYLDTLRTLETRVSAIDAQQAEAARAKSEQKASRNGFASSPPIEVSIPTQTLKWGEHTRLMGDLMILAFQTDLTRVCSMIPSFKPDGRYEEIGIHQQHHELTHLENGPEKTEKLCKIDRFNLELFGYIITRMKGLKEGGGTLLDNCIMMWGSGMDGPTVNETFGHGKSRLPTIIAGHGGGTIRTGRYVPKSDGNIGDLLTAILARAGVKLDKPFGCGTRMLPTLS